MDIGNTEILDRFLIAHESSHSEKYGETTGNLLIEEGFADSKEDLARDKFKETDKTLSEAEKKEALAKIKDEVKDERAISDSLTISSEDELVEGKGTLKQWGEAGLQLGGGALGMGGSGFFILNTSGFGTVLAGASFIHSTNTVVEGFHNLWSLTLGNEENYGKYDNKLKNTYENLGQAFGGENGKKIGELAYYGADIFLGAYGIYNGTRELISLGKASSSLKFDKRLLSSSEYILQEYDTYLKGGSLTLSLAGDSNGLYSYWEKYKDNKKSNS